MNTPTGLLVPAALIAGDVDRRDEPDTTLSALCAIFAVSWIAGVLVLSRRS